MPYTDERSGRTYTGPEDLRSLIGRGSYAIAGALGLAHDEGQDETYDELFDALKALGRASRAVKQEVTS